MARRCMGFGSVDLAYRDETGDAAWDPPCGCTDDGLCVFDHGKIGADTGSASWDILRRNPRYGRRERGETFAQVCTTPNEYMKLAAGSRGGRIQAEYDSVADQLATEYAASMRAGAKFPVPVVEWKMQQRDIFHRSCCLATEAFRKLENRARRGVLSMREGKLLREMRTAVSRECGRLVGSQEGRHRVLAAQAIGVRRVPVMIQLPISDWTPERGRTLDGWSRRRRSR